MKLYKVPPLNIALLCSKGMTECPLNVAIDCSAKYKAPPFFKAALVF